MMNCDLHFISFLFFDIFFSMDDIGDNTQGWDGEWFSCP